LLAEGSSEGNDGGGIRGIGACLVGAVTYTVSEARFGAVAGDVTSRAAKRALGDVQHVVDACLTALRKLAEVLGGSNGSPNGEKSNGGLHLAGERLRETLR
jgi:hypothetical protein